ncbi:MAG TPA: DMT family transporter [Anaerolineales bacterium]|nr:DMT family transporter [Anaerolineales bacterium]
MSSGTARRSAALAALFVVFLWATSWVLIEFGLEAIPPLTFAGLRYGLASLVLLPALHFSGAGAALRSLTRQDIGRLILLGILLYGVTQGAVFLALDALPAVTVNLLWSFSVIVVAGMAALWLSETPTALQWTGVIVATLGALIYFLPARFALDQRFGLLAALVGVTVNAGAAVLGRDVNRSGRTPPVVVTAVSMLVGAALLLGAGLALEEPPTLDLRGWSIILWLAVVNTALAFTLWNSTLRVLTAVESSIINGTMLIWIPILAAAFLGEQLTLKQAAGLLLVAGGTLLVQLRGRPRAGRPQAR